MLWVIRSVEFRADPRRHRYLQWSRPARDTGATHRDVVGHSARCERAADACGHARCPGDERRDARHHSSPMGVTAPGNEAHPFVLRRRAHAARARKREGPGDSLRARAGRHSQISSRSPDIRPQISTQPGHRRVYASQGRAVPCGDPSGRNASRRNGAAAPAAGPESRSRRERAVARGARASCGAEPRHLQRRRAVAAVRPRRQRPLQSPHSARMC